MIRSTYQSLLFCIVALVLLVNSAFSEVIGVPGPGVNRYPDGGMRVAWTRFVAELPPTSVQTDSTGDNAYLLRTWGAVSRVSKVDMVGGVVVAERPLDFYALNFALDQAGAALLVSDGKRVHRLSTATLQDAGVLDLALPEGQAIGCILSAPAYRRGYCATFFPNQIIEIDLDSLTVLRRGPHLDYGSSIARFIGGTLDEAGGRAYFLMDVGLLLSHGWVGIELESLDEFARKFYTGFHVRAGPEIDPAHGVAYYTNISDAQVNYMGAFRLSDLEHAGSAVTAAIGGIVLDSGGSRVLHATGSGCIGRTSVPSLVPLSQECTAPQWAGFTVLRSLPQNRILCSGYLDGYRLGILSTAPGLTIVKDVLIDSEDRGTAILMADSSREFLYRTNTSTPAVVERSGTDAALFLNPDSVRLPDQESPVTCGVVVPSTGRVLLATNTSPARIVEIESTETTFARVGGIVLEPGEDSVFCAALDEAAGYAYFATLTSPGHIVRVRLDPLERVDAVTLESGEDLPRALMLDTDSGSLLAGLFTVPARVVRLDTSTFSRVDSMTLPEGEQEITCGAWDPTRRLAVFGTATAPARAIMVDAETFTHAGTVTMNAGEDFFRAIVHSEAVDDMFAIAGTVPPRVVRINAGSQERIGARTLDSNTFADSIVAIPGSDEIVVSCEAGPVTYPLLTTLTTSLRGYAYGTAVSIPEPGRIRNIRFYSHEADGNLAFAIYNADRMKIWQCQAVPNTQEDGWLTVSIGASGAPDMAVESGPFFLVWQTDSHRPVAGWSHALGDTCFLTPTGFPEFPFFATPNQTYMEWNANNYAIAVEFVPDNVVSSAANWSLYD